MAKATYAKNFRFSRAFRVRKRKLSGFASLRLKIPLDNALPPHFLRYSSDDNTIIIPLYYHNNTIILPLTMVF